MTGACASCGTPDEELTAVHRVYLVPEPHRLEELEWWCVPCRTMYPHEEAAG